MRELRALGLSDDGRSLVLADLSAGTDSERFKLAVDDRLRTIARPTSSRPAPPPETRVESALTPREIQARLRAGQTAEEVARAAGIPIGRVQRYEAPILAERSRIVSEARRASAPGPHRNTPGRPLGSLVDERLSDEGLDPESVEWDARRRPDGTWLVSLSAEQHSATWSWDPAARRVRAHDDGATVLLSPPASGPDSLIALAQATGVTTEDRRPPANAAAVAVGGEGSDPTRESRRPTTPSRAAGLKVVPDAPGRPEPTTASATATATATDTDTGTAASKPAPPQPAAPVSADTASTNAASTDAAATAALEDRHVPGGGPMTPPTARDVPSSVDLLLPGSSSARSAESQQPSAMATESGAYPAVADEPTEAPAKPSTRAAAGRRRSAVPAWDDIMFGARRS